ncbi:DUF1801 domain-containing protein [Marivita sp. S6314]|uniref:DUF1801 domain-containing protein n=1 Tax=Marivita sp. S6314 TaxID=2926406 RepID=UPI001FF21740|nr:DUF1801 domain-containing protein [Marivita sp. S6314]MCK0149665.1 DUF1801 domain-containing protein [Marivita sp. S6314]
MSVTLICMSQVSTPPPDVEAALAAHPEDVQGALRALREMILDVAANTDGVGPITETLKWGQPSFEAMSPKTGTPLRIGVPKTGGVALYTHCQTTVMSQARDVFSDSFDFDGNRAVLLPTDGAWPDAALRQIMRSALTYRIKPAGAGR